MRNIKQGSTKGTLCKVRWCVYRLGVLVFSFGVY